MAILAVPCKPQECRSPQKTTTKNISSECILNLVHRDETWKQIWVYPLRVWGQCSSPLEKETFSLFFFFLKLHTLIGIILAGFCIPYSLIPYKAIRSVNALKGTLQYVIWHFAHYLGTYNKSAFCQGLQSRLPRDLLSTSAQFVK